MSRLVGFFILVSLSLLGSGCAVISRPLIALDPKPVLIHLPGIGGENAFERWYLSSLRDGGFDADLELHEWTRGQFAITTLQAYGENHRVARLFADEITARKRAQPHRPIFLSCDSGGAGPVVWALEALPDDVEVEAVVMIAPALSPDYDLSRALMHVRQKVLVFASHNDTFVLGWGTQTWGTMDGKRVSAAGSVGFVTPQTASDPSQYAKLETLWYKPEWFGKYGNAGDHTGAMGSKFASGYIAPLLTKLAQNVAVEQHTVIETKAAVASQ